MMKCTTLFVLLLLMTPLAVADQTRPSATDDDLKFWLQNMVWHHRYSLQEMTEVTGLDVESLQAKLNAFGISEDSRPPRPEGTLLMLPYPGGRHPRIGFLDGAVDPQRDTKLSVFCPWDDHSYVVMDVPEAIWSNLGLTYLAHTHVDTIWTKQGMDLPQREWQRRDDGSFVMKRRLPNGIEFGTVARAVGDHIELEMWLRNETQDTLTDLRVQNCVMLKAADGFAEQINDNKLLTEQYAVARSQDSQRWIISGWSPIHRPWANPPCPCIHADPKFPDCAPGETQWLRGWLSFHEGSDIQAELDRITATGWQERPLNEPTGNVIVTVRDADTRQLLPCRVTVRSTTENSWHFAEPVAPSGSAVTYRKQVPNSGSVEQHTTVSADPIQFHLPAGTFHIRVEHGKEYLPHERVTTVTDERQALDVELRRFADLADLGWYSGDIHVHRQLAELPNVVLAEDVNVALPLTHWVRDSREIPAASGPVWPPILDQVDPTHVIWPVNTEYEIFTVNGRRHTQGAVFVLNHQTPLQIPAPPVVPVAEEARRQGALLDLDKHSWNWSLMIIPLMSVDLFELTNNHHWRTQFGFPAWTLENAPADWPEIERTEAGFTELGWTEFGMQTYYALLNCGFRLRVSGGTASGVHPVPLGHGRVYVHTGPEFHYDRWIAGLNAGHSFATNGPVMDIRFDGELPGTTWKSEADSRTITVTGKIFSVAPLRSIEIIRNGETTIRVPVVNHRTGAGAYENSVEVPVDVRGSGWITLRCFEDLPQDKVSFAHTNPVYVDVAGQPLRPRTRDVSYFVSRMDQEVERNAGILSDEALAEFRQARAIYAALLQAE